MVVSKYSHTSMERILHVTRGDDARAVMLAGGRRFAENLFTLSFNSPPHFVVEPHHFVELVVPLVSRQYF